ncbi:response regulator transcription factor [Kocuria sp. cx-455]|uniref:response regulator transcription factor n=1 Tax=Kocuria sp. cx-455 TaxID=2771377 RepID=UPI003D71E8B0
MTSAAESTEATKVYVVDDDPGMCESVKWLLESIDIVPTLCLSADEFINQYNGDRPACIILDVRMPKMSGPKLQEHINKTAPYISIIFVSAHGDIRMSVAALQGGAQDFIEKPYEPQRLLEAVQTGVESAGHRFAEHQQRELIATRLATLTPREREILTFVIEGYPSQNIARKLGMSVKTVDVHRARIKNKTESESISTLVRDILRAGLDVRSK